MDQDSFKKQQKKTISLNQTSEQLFWKSRKSPVELFQLSTLQRAQSGEWRAMVGEDARGPPAHEPFWLTDVRPAVLPVRRRCLWTRCTCSDPSSSSRCSASSWRSVWTWWLCSVQPGSPPTISPCLCGSPAPSPRHGTRRRRRRLRGAASPPSHLVRSPFVPRTLWFFYLFIYFGSFLRSALWCL